MVCFAEQDSSGYGAAPSIPPKRSAGPLLHVERLPPPPPYSPSTGPATSSATSNTLAQPQRSPSSILSPQTAQTVNHFEMFSNHNPISGTFLVDPTMPRPGITVDGLRKLRKKSAKAWGKSSRPDDIHASFRTRHGHMDLDLAAVTRSEGPAASTSAGDKVPTCIAVSSQHGRINVNLFEIQPGRSVDLNIESQHGKIVLLLPPSYDGPLMFQTRSINSITLLPEFAARARTLRATDRETLIVCGPSSSEGPVLKTDTKIGDRALVRTQHGRIIVGISGVDKVEEAAPRGGLFQKLGGKLFGRSS
ncbi:hypothetical protein GY45DRAFT_601051 [Cubamyces sp. BRFM 1775]|nr:hypothetical protein GY45DRAFT_601051 [Cubamyces sp. BRFM 1775]